MSHIYLTQFLERAGGLYPDKAALRCDGRSSSWGEVRTTTRAMAGGLRALGLQADERVAILALNSDRYVEILFSVWRLSAAVVPFNTRWTAEELDYGLADSTPALLIVDDIFAAILPKLTLPSSIKAIVHIGTGPTPEGTVSYDTLLSSGTPVEDLGRGGSAMAGIFYTGGTTGHPKGVMLTHTGLVATLLAMGQKEEDDTPRPLLCVLPMFHLAGVQLPIAAAINAVEVIIHGQFDLEVLLECIETDKIDTLSLVPAMWGMLVSHPKADTTDLSSLRRAAYGASPMPEGILRKCIARLPDAEFSQGYGQTETAGVCTLLGPEDHDPDGPNTHRLRSAGQPILFSELRILAEDGRERPRGEVGEIAIRSSGNMLGYWNKPDETEKTLKDGWIMSGDAGYMDADGYVYIVDRTKDMIISGGENVYSAETESALSAHPAVLECAVIGVPDETWGERVHAIVRLVPGADADAESLIDHCKAKIAGYKCPRSVDFRAEPMPLSAAGKVLKRELRAPYWDGATRNVN